MGVRKFKDGEIVKIAVHLDKLQAESSPKRGELVRIKAFNVDYTITRLNETETNNLFFVFTRDIKKCSETEAALAILEEM